MILLEVPPKLIIYKSDSFITICQCEKCICNELLHYAYTYYTSSYILCYMNLEAIQQSLVARKSLVAPLIFRSLEIYLFEFSLLKIPRLMSNWFSSSIKSWVDGQEIKWWGIVINLFFGQLVSGKVQKVSLYLPHLI